MSSMKTTLLALGCAAGAACVCWWWASTQQTEAYAERIANARAADAVEEDEASIHRKHRVSAEPTMAPQRADASAPAQSRAAAAPAPAKEPAPVVKKTNTMAQQRQAPPIPTPAPVAAIETTAAGKGSQDASTPPPPTAAAPDAAAAAAAATTEWAALHAEGWRRAAAHDEWKSRVVNNGKWISCRAARTAASEEAKKGKHGGNAQGGAGKENGEEDLENGVWCEETEDRYSGAGGRGV